jgi:regulator of chromosome condensation
MSTSNPRQAAKGAKSSKAAKAQPTRKQAAAAKIPSPDPVPSTKPTKPSKPAREPAQKNTPAAKKSTAPAKKAEKRKAEDDLEDEAQVNGVKRVKSPPTERVRAPAKAKLAAGKTAAAKKTKAKAEINHALTEKLNVYVFGEGSSGELGLGSAKGQSEVKRPRFNPNLSPDTVGVVALSVGGMHTAVLTHDSKILTWGVNDQGALGRDTTWEGGLRDMDEDDSDSDSDSGSETAINPKESTPGEVDLSGLPDGVVFTQVACTDSATFALTTEGDVYGWGTFRSNEGIFGFDPTTLIQLRPKLIKGLSKVTQLATGANHVLALQSNGAVYGWGSGQQNQLGRRILERRATNSLVPMPIGLPKKIVSLGAGAYNSFAVRENGDVYSWGLNNFGQTGIPKEFDESGASKGSDVHHPIIIDSLHGKGKVTCIQGGAHHTVAVTDKGELLVWGRIDGHQSGLKVADLPAEDVVRDSAGHPRILTVPTQIPDIDAVYAAAGSDHCIAIDKNGKAYSWGFSTTYQTGLGTDDDVEVATLIDNTAVRNTKLVWAGAGGQFSVVAGQAAPMVNGVNGHA